MKTLSIIIPFLSGVDFTLQTLYSIRTELPVNLILLDNGAFDSTAEQVEKLYPIWSKDINIINSQYIFGQRSVSQSWNFGISQSLKSDYILIANNDIILHPKTIDNLIRFIDKTDYVMVTARNINDGKHLSTDLFNYNPADFDEEDLKPITNWREEGPDFSCFLIKPDFINKIGWFDENFFPAYFEDNNAHTVIVKSGFHAKRVSTAPYFHYGSTTVNNNPGLKKIIENKYFEKNKQYFISKWGDGPSAVLDGKGFDYPFNSDKSLSWWEGVSRYASV